MQEKRKEQKDLIIGFYKKNKRMPGYNEIMDLLSFKSKNSVHKLINWMTDAGVVSKDEKGRIIPNQIYEDIPILGLVEAGFPVDVDEDELDRVSLEDFLIDDKEKTYILEVKGDSMIEAFITEGDYVLVEKTDNAKEGQIVIAEIDGGLTMKYFRRKGKKVFLEPANKKYKSIYPKFSFRVAAVVKAVVRKL